MIWWTLFQVALHLPSYDRGRADGDGAGAGSPEGRRQWLQFRPPLAFFSEPKTLKLQNLANRYRNWSHLRLKKRCIDSTGDVLTATVRVRVLPKEDANGSKDAVITEQAVINK